jgi:Domain of unknown function (DUF5753)
MPDYRQASALESFIASLNRAWSVAGQPSYAELGRLSRQLQGQLQPSGLQVEPLAASTAHEILSGQRCRPPRWRWVASFVTVLRAAAAKGGVNPDIIGSLEEWKARHEAVCTALRAAPQPARVAADGGRPGAAPGAAEPDEDGENARNTAFLDVMRSQAGGKWWRDYRDVVPAWFETYMSLETAASLIRTYEPAVVPGLLQTREYARAILRLGQGTSDMTLQRRVEFRMRRQEMWRQKALSDLDPPRVWAVIDEAALWCRIVDSQTMRHQIEHLIAMCEQPHISIQVVPLDASAHAASGGPITILRFHDCLFPDIVYLEQLTSALYLHELNDISHYAAVLDSLGIEAVRPSSTPALLRKILGDSRGQ